MEKDPDELNNVIHKFTDPKKQLEKMFAAWLKEIEAPSEVAVRYGVEDRL